MYMPGKQITESNIKLIGGSQSLSPAQKSPAKRSSLEARKQREEFKLKNRFVDLQDKNLAIKDKEAANARKRDSDEHRRKMKALEIEDKKTPDADKKVIDDRVERTMRFKYIFWATVAVVAVFAAIFLLLVFTNKYETVAKNTDLTNVLGLLGGGGGVAGTCFAGHKIYKKLKTDKSSEKESSK